MGAQEVISLAAGLHPSTTLDAGAAAGAHSTLSWVLYVAEWVLLVAVTVTMAVSTVGVVVAW